MRMKRDMRENQDFKSTYPNVFMVEHLTPMRSKVAYKLRHDTSIEKCWTIDGKIKVVKVGASSQDKPITIDSLADLKDLGWHQNEIDELALSELCQLMDHEQPTDTGKRHMNTRFMEISIFF